MPKLRGTVPHHVADLIREAIPQEVYAACRWLFCPLYRPHLKPALRAGPANKLLLLRGFTSGNDENLDTFALGPWIALGPRMTSLSVLGVLVVVWSLSSRVYSRSAVVEWGYTAMLV